MPEGYALKIDGDAYKPIPESWLEHPRAIDVREGESEHRLYAVSVAVASPRMIRVRYAHPISFEVLHRRSNREPQR